MLVDVLVDEGLEILSPDECRRLLGTGKVGRVVLSLGALPAAFPVNYAVFDGGIYFFTGPGLKLRAALSGAVVAFELDDIDTAEERGWSVLAVGVADQVDDEVRVEQLKLLGLRPWVRGDRNHLVRIRPTFLSGRRIM